MIARWEVGICGDTITGPVGELDVPDGLARDIAARLNGPSPAEVAALLRSVEWTLAHDGEDACPCCHATRPEGHDDCKLAAMIKQCEGA